LIVPGGIGKTSFTYEGIDDKLYCLKMSGQSTFKVAVKRMTEVSREALAHNGFSESDVDLVVPHQANQRIIETVAEKMGLPLDKFFININKYGNTGAASIPIAIHEAREAGRTEPGTVMLLTVLGAGLTWGAVVVKW
jgi:3-oxoacyl-[acyl-carrier-protein] synthase-3